MGLALIALALQGVAYFYWDWFPPKPNFSALEILRIRAAWAEEDWQREQKFHKAIKPFDPNRVDSTFLADLNLPLPLQNSWRAYLRANGRFKTVEDLRGLYHMDSLWYANLAPYAEVRNPRRGEASFTSSKQDLNLKAFDPNWVEKDELVAMGLDAFQSQSILNFRIKFRPFCDSTDLYKVYGLSEDLVQQLIPYVKIEKAPTEEPVMVLLNQADSLSLEQLKGLGPFRIQKLLHWRKRLGGFHSTQQLLELNILDTLGYRRLKPFLQIERAHRRLNINSANLEALKAHPYINYYLARNIINFREQIRPFHSVVELMNIELVDDVLFSKLAPYLKVSEIDTSALTLSN